jgi:hypothetical protein
MGICFASDDQESVASRMLSFAATLLGPVLAQLVSVHLVDLFQCCIARCVLMSTWHSRFSGLQPVKYLLEALRRVLQQLADMLVTVLADLLKVSIEVTGAQVSSTSPSILCHRRPVRSFSCRMPLLHQIRNSAPCLRLLMPTLSNLRAYESHTDLYPSVSDGLGRWVRTLVAPCDTRSMPLATPSTNLERFATACLATLWFSL